MGEGELVAFMSAGAYGYVMANRYNTRAMAAEVLVKGSAFELVNARETFEQMIAGSGGGLEHLRDLMAALHRDLWDVCSQSVGKPAARKVFQTALQEAISVHPDLAVRCGLARPLEA